MLHQTENLNCLEFLLSTVNPVAISNRYGLIALLLFNFRDDGVNIYEFIYRNYFGEIQSHRRSGVFHRFCQSMPSNNNHSSYNQNAFDFYAYHANSDFYSNRATIY